MMPPRVRTHDSHGDRWHGYRPPMHSPVHHTARKYRLQLPPTRIPSSPRPLKSHLRLWFLSKFPTQRIRNFEMGTGIVSEEQGIFFQHQGNLYGPARTPQRRGRPGNTPPDRGPIEASSQGGRRSDLGVARHQASSDRVERRINRDERNAVRIHFDHSGKVRERSGQPVDDHDIDALLPDVFEQTLKGAAHAWIPRTSPKFSERRGLGNGGGGIRTHEGLSSLPVFKTGAFNHSATPPTLSK
jgi:hypothetical protein